jgi:hypothetical protein
MKISRTGIRSVRGMCQLSRYSTWNRKKTTLFSGHYLCKLSNFEYRCFWLYRYILTYGTLPKFGTFLLGHTVCDHLMHTHTYINIQKYAHSHIHKYTHTHKHSGTYVQTHIIHTCSEICVSRMYPSRNCFFLFL